jgi:hypothetical protein
LAFADDNLNQIDARMSPKDVDGVSQDGPSGQFAILLWNFATAAHTASGSDDQGSYAGRAVHRSAL